MSEENNEKKNEFPETINPPPSDPKEKENREKVVDNFVSSIVDKQPQEKEDTQNIPPPNEKPHEVSDPPKEEKTVPQPPAVPQAPSVPQQQTLQYLL